MIIRLAKKEDFPSILPLFKELDAKHSRNSSDMKENIAEQRYTILFFNAFTENSNLTITVAEQNTEILGFAVSKMTVIKDNLIFKDAVIGEILYVAVDNMHKKSGIGTKLMLDMEQRLKSKGVTRLELRVFSFNSETLPEKVNYKAKYTVYEKY